MLNLRVAIRSLRRAPAFAIAVVLSLALGIGANSTMFTMLDAVLLRPLPYAQSDELVAPSLGTSDVVPDSYLLAWAASTHTLAAVAEYNSTTSIVAGAAPPEERPGAMVSPALVRVLGVAPTLGRFIMADDGLANAPSVVVLGHDAWQHQFSGDPHVLGRTITIEGTPATVVGVMPKGFAFPPHAEYWLPRPPLDPRPAAALRVGMAVARMRSGVSSAQVQRELALTPRTPDLLHWASLRDAPVVVQSLHDDLYGSARSSVVMLSAAVLLLLLIACANVANLVLARTTRRRQVFAVRSALGASRAALYWEVVTECLLLAVAGGALGVLLSVWLSRLFASLNPNALANVGRIGVDARVIMFTLGVSILTAFLISSGPALKVAGGGMHALMGASGSRVGDGPVVRVVRRLLVALQLSAAVVLLTGAGLLVKSLALLTNQDNGFQADHLLIVSVDPPPAQYRGTARGAQLADALTSRLQALPGVRHVATGPGPLKGYRHMYPDISTTDAANAPPYRIPVSEVSGGFFETYGISVIAGRAIAASDDSTSPPVVVVNRTAARLIAPGGNVIGRSLDVVTINRQHPTIVGVVADVPLYDITAAPRPAAYSSAKQDPHWPSFWGVRVTGSPEALARSVQAAVNDLDPALVVRTRSMESQLSSSYAPHRFTAALLGTFATLALILAAVGLFGVIAYLVEQRTREIGVRIALGAQQRDVLREVLREGLTLTGAGVGVGVTLALVFSHLMRSLLYKVPPTDIGVVVATASALSAVALLAAYVPARRAMRVDPMVALRTD